MKIAVTGADGFIAWHTRCAIRARWGGDAVLVGREHFADPQLMAKDLGDVDAIVHLAGVNRASDDDAIATVNPWLARQLVEGLKHLGRPVSIVYGNSIHADGESVFGRAKREAADVLAAHARDMGASFADVVLPNVFGEWGRPFYNSVVATFSFQVAHGLNPTIEEDRELPLLHVQRAAEILLDAAVSHATGRIDPSGVRLPVSEILGRITALAEPYRFGDLPDLADTFTRDLFNTYRSFTFPHQWPVHPQVRGDQRGDLFETVRGSGGESQVFVSTTRPGFTRGQHFHLRKVERFIVLRGSGLIRLRKLFTDEVTEFPVSGDRPAIVDMPTMWVHSITNTGRQDLLTQFYADELFDADRPDTFPEEV